MRRFLELSLAAGILTSAIIFGVLAMHPLTALAQVGLPTNPPTSESDSCTGGQALFSAATCTITLIGNGGSPVSDGMVLVGLTAPANSAVLSCADTQPCTLLNGGQTVSLGCASGMPPNSCVSVDFAIASPIDACLSNPADCSASANLSSSGATVTVSFLAAPGNNGAGGILLNTDSIPFSGPGIGTLLVTATPQVVPSNGTATSLVTATFACANQNVQYGPGGFPLSALGFRNLRRATQIIDQPVLGMNDAAVCGAGLPGTFTFTAPKNVIFDNFRSQEGIGCGLNSNVSPFGGQSAILPYHSTLPLAFTCTGAAVLAFGNGAGGDAPIQVSYTSAVAGLSAVGSTLLTVTPAAAPIPSMSCQPATIAAGGPGLVCTVLVADQNGVPMSGLTGATVTWTTTDTSRTVVAACGTGLFGAPYPATTPPLVPQLSPITPCQLPSTSTPSEVSTFINGQASAVVSSPAGSSPGVVSISATVGVAVPPAAACESAPYLPALNPPLISTGLPSVTGCGAGNPVGFTGLASAFPTETGALSSSTTVTLPNSGGASAAISIVANTSGFQIAGTDSSTSIALSTTSTAPPLIKGCNQIVATSVAGTPISQLAGLVMPASSVTSIWAFNNGTQQWRSAYFSDPEAPIDFNISGGTADSQQGSTTQPGTGGLASIDNLSVPPGTQVAEAYLVCVNQAATIASG